jgi:heme-degrading monooxygenase HmoA
MYVRLTFLQVDPNATADVSTVYKNEVLPAIQEFKGLEEAMLLEPSDGTGEYVSFTAWTSKAEADEYEKSGTYRRLVDLMKDKYTAKPVLKTYQAQSIRESVI